MIRGTFMECRSGKYWSERGISRVHLECSPLLDYFKHWTAKYQTTTVRKQIFATVFLSEVEESWSVNATHCIAVGLTKSNRILYFHVIWTELYEQSTHIMFCWYLNKFTCFLKKFTFVIFRCIDYFNIYLVYIRRSARLEIINALVIK